MRRKNNLPFFVVVMHVMQIILKSLEFSNGQDDEGWSHHLPLLAMDSFIDENRSIFVVFDKTGPAWFLRMTNFWQRKSIF
jgi:hypothetical protein